VRACMAYIAARLITKRDFIFLFDCQRNVQLKLCGRCHEQKIAVTDHEDKAEITGSTSGDSITLYHHKECHYIEMNIFQNRFGGYDHGTCCHFSGEVKEDGVFVYDFSETGHFEYKFCP